MYFSTDKEAKIVFSELEKLVKKINKAKDLGRVEDLNGIEESKKTKGF